MAEWTTESCTAFAGTTRLACGALASVALAAKAAIDAGEAAPVLIFDDDTARLVEVDLRGAREDVLKRLAPQPSAERGPGRPRLGVVAREVTLLPRHWEWLSGQPGGASVALRKLVEQARHANTGEDRLRLSQEAAYRFMAAMAGDAPGFEEAARALFSGNGPRFEAEVEKWPADIRDYARRLAGPALRDYAAG